MNWTLWIFLRQTPTLIPHCMVKSAIQYSKLRPATLHAQKSDQIPYNFRIRVGIVFRIFVRWILLSCRYFCSTILSGEKFMVHTDHFLPPARSSNILNAAFVVSQALVLKEDITPRWDIFWEMLIQFRHFWIRVISFLEIVKNNFDANSQSTR